MGTPSLAGFRPSPSGLLVPEELSREREVWTRADKQIYNRFVDLMKRRGLRSFIACERDDCGKLDVFRNLDGTITMRCAHKDRILTNL